MLVIGTAIQGALGESSSTTESGTARPVGNSKQSAHVHLLHHIKLSQLVMQVGVLSALGSLYAMSAHSVELATKLEEMGLDEEGKLPEGVALNRGDNHIPVKDSLWTMPGG